MEPDKISTGPVKPPPLNSDQLNYLIWRYLQEAGYGDAAVNLQRDWKVEAETLPFAKHIKGQALISLVQKGLRYHHLSLTIDESGRQTKKLEPSMFFFGPDDARLDASTKDSLIQPNDIQRVASPLNPPGSTPRKRETEPNGVLDGAGASAKRSRKVTQTTERTGLGPRKPSGPSTHDSPVSMDVDSINGQTVPRNVRSPSAGEGQHDEHAVNGLFPDYRMDVDADVSNMAGDHGTNDDQPRSVVPAIIHTLTNGESVGVQVVPAKVANLGPSTVVLSVAEQTPVTSTAWRPGDRFRLTASGHHFCGICQLTGPNVQTNGFRPPYRSLLGPEDANLVTAFAWASNGSLLAVATYAEHGGHIHIFDGSELALVQTLPGSHRAITSLKWLSESSSLVGIVPGDDGDDSDRGTASILTWDISAMLQGQVTEPDTQQIPSTEILMDLDIADTQEGSSVLVAGRNAVYKYVYRTKVNPGEERKIRDSRRFGSPPDHTDGWSFIRCRPRQTTTEFVVVASADSACIWLPLANLYRGEAHTAPITGLELRPRAYHDTEQDSTIFATCSIDGTIKVWQYRLQSNSLNQAYKLHIDRASPVMAISYSPDGFCLAGASYDEVNIWNAEHGYNLMASWQGKDTDWEGTPLKEEELKNGDARSSINGDGGPGVSEHGLAWDTDSKRLAFGLGSQVAVIDFQR